MCKIVRHFVDAERGMEVMDVRDSHGRTMQFQCGILPGNPAPSAYFDACLKEFAEQEIKLTEHKRNFKSRTLLAGLLLLLLAPFAKAAPAITVSASAVTLLGSSQSISITVQLIDPYNTGMLKVSGTGIVPIMRASTVTPGTTATVGPIYGNDVILNAFGNANVTYYLVQVFPVVGGFVSSTPALQNFYAFTGSGTIDLATATPLVPNFMNSSAGVSIPGNFSVTGLASFPGGGTHSGTETFTGNINLTAPGQFLSNAQEDHNTSLINSFSPVGEAHNIFSNTMFFLDGAVGGVVVPNTSNQGQVNGVWGGVVDLRANPATPSVGVFGSARAGATNARIWGVNSVAYDQAGISSTNMNSIETDCFVANVASVCRAISVDAFLEGGIQPTNIFGIEVGATQGTIGGTWTYGLRFDQGATPTPSSTQAAIGFYPTASGVSQNSQGMQFISTRSDGAQPIGGLYQLPDGTLRWAVGATAGFECNSCNSIRGSAAGLTDVGSTAIPFGNLWLGTAATNNFKFAPAATAAARTVTLNDPLGNVSLPFTIASGISAMTTALIAAGACGTTVTTAATGVLTTDTIDFAHNTAVTNANGGILILNAWPTSGNVNFNYCNPTAAGVTPTAMTVNWSVRRP